MSQRCKPPRHAPLSQWASLLKPRFKDRTAGFQEGSRRGSNPAWAVCVWGLLRPHRLLAWDAGPTGHPALFHLCPLLKQNACLPGDLPGSLDPTLLRRIGLAWHLGSYLSARTPKLLADVKVEDNFTDCLQVTKVVTVLEAQRRLCGDRILHKWESHVIKVTLN